MQKSFSHKWIVFLIGLLIMQVAANFDDYKTAFKDDQFLMESLFQVQETDLDQDNTSEFVICGKNYTGRELFAYWMVLGGDGKPTVKWQSPNLFEDRSVLWVASGKFEGTQNQLLVLTETNYYLFQYQNGTLNLEKRGSHNIKPLLISGADLNGDGRTELVVAGIGKITTKQYDDVVQFWQFQDGNFVMTGQASGTFGNIRGLTAGDLNGDGKAEIFIDEGVQNRAGQLHMYGLAENNRLIEKARIAKPNGVIYAMKVKSGVDGPRLFTASSTGRLNIWSLNASGALVALEKERAFNSSFVDLAVADQPDAAPVILTVAYPRRFMVLCK